ncbi:MAG: dihydroorotase, partial [Rhodobacteraceae bacterium]|nr:dihydroorotase [Paracoccaceae bacterium]
MILHFTNARMIDPETQTDSLGSLTVKDGLIIARDEIAPKGANLRDLGGKCLAPG